MSNRIANVLDIVNQYADQNKSFDRKLKLNTAKAMQKVRHAVTDNFSQGYCMLFAVPEPEVVALFTEIPEIDAKVLHDAFVSGWQLPANAMMLRQTYYHSAMLLFMYASLKKNESLAEQALALILFRMWNGRRYKLIKFCDPNVMSYVVSNMMNNQYLPTKYNTPYEMIVNYFATTMAKKYMSYMVKDLNKSKLVLNQTHRRIEQVFKSNAAPDLQTGKTRYTSGLMPLYFKAKEEGYRISSNHSFNDDGPTADEMFSGHNYESITDTTVHSIITNHTPKYDSTYHSFIKKESKNVKQSIVDIIMMSFYTPKFKDHLTDIVSLMLKRLEATESSLCSNDFLPSVKKAIVSSKHNPEVTQIKGVADAMLTTIFATKMSTPIDYDRWAKMSKAQFRRILIYSIAYNISKAACK